MGNDLFVMQNEQFLPADFHLPALPTDQKSRLAGYPQPELWRPRPTGPTIDIDFPPDRHESFLLADGEKKVETEVDTRESYCGYLRHVSISRLI